MAWGRSQGRRKAVTARRQVLGVESRMPQAGVTAQSNVQDNKNRYLHSQNSNASSWGATLKQAEKAVSDRVLAKVRVLIWASGQNRACRLAVEWTA